MHAPGHSAQRSIGHFDCIYRLVVVHVQKPRVVVGLDVLQQMSLIVIAAAHQRGHVVGQLQRREQVVGLADGGGNGLAVGPLLIVAFRPLGGGQHAAGVADLNAGGLPQPELGGVAVQCPDTGEPSHLIEKVVAGVGDGLRHIDASVGGAGLTVDPAHGLRILVIGVDTAVLDDGGRRDDAALQCRHRRHHLECGAWGINALGGAVEHG